MTCNFIENNYWILKLILISQKYSPDVSCLRYYMEVVSSITALTNSGCKSHDNNK